MGLHLLYCLGLLIEDRGWRYYQKRLGSSGAVSNVMLEVQVLFEPGYHHVLEERRSQRYDEAKKEIRHIPGGHSTPSAKTGRQPLPATIVRNARASTRPT